MTAAGPRTAWIGLGGNLGDRRTHLVAAIAGLGRLGALRARSPLYETEPVGPPQPRYLNAAVRLETARSPETLLADLLAIEASLGRTRTPGLRDAPRTLDLDVLLLGDHGEEQIDTPALVVPHPRLHLRAFALAPLVDLDPTLVHPTLGRPLTALLADRLAHEPPPRRVPWDDDDQPS